MGCKLNNTTLSLLIQEDLEWLLKQEKTLEREHIRLILEEKIRELNELETRSSCQINSTNEPHIIYSKGTVQNPW